jgi:hypothetical protein
MATEAELRAVKLRHSARLLQMPDVCGVGIEKDEAGEYVLVVHVNALEARSEAKLPKTLEGHRLKVVRSGPFGSESKK